MKRARLKPGSLHFCLGPIQVEVQL